jgi:hypothetical protein
MNGPRSIQQKRRFNFLYAVIWAELNAYFVLLFWGLAGVGLFEGRGAEVPDLSPWVFVTALIGPIGGAPLAMFIGPRYIWMLESIVQKFETRAKPGKILHGEVEISS